MPNQELPFEKILLNQLACIKCERTGDKQLKDVKALTERNAPLKVNARILTNVKATPENYFAVQCYNCAELTIVDRFKFENLIINKSKIGHWDQTKIIKVNELGFISIQ